MNALTNPYNTPCLFPVKGEYHTLVRPFFPRCRVCLYRDVKGSSIPLLLHQDIE